MSRTQDLVDQIKQITIEIRDIKGKKQDNIDIKKRTSTINTRNHKRSDPLQECHEEHDEDVEHYIYSEQTVHQLPDSKHNLVHYAPTPLPPEEEPTSSLPWPPVLHPSSPSNGSPAKPTSKRLPWSEMPNDPESPGNEEDNAGRVDGLPWTTTNGIPSGGDESVVCPADDDKKAGV